MREGPWRLPEGWAWSEFRGVANVASNLVDPANYPDYPHIAPNHIESETGRLLPYNTVSHDGVTSPKHLFHSGQVLYSKIRPYLAKVVVAEFEGLCSADMYPIDTALDSRFLKWWMLSREFTRQAAGQQARTVLPKINRKSLERLSVPVPPLDEQRRIVAILEDHLSHLDAAASALDLVQDRISAFDIASHRQLLFGSTWPQRRLTDLLTEFIGGVWGGAPGEDDIDVRVLRVTELRPGGRIDVRTAAARSISTKQLGRRSLQPGDLLLEKSGGGPTTPVGRVGLVGNLGGYDSVCSNFMQLMRPDRAQVLPEYLHSYLHGFYLLGQTIQLQTASTNIRNIKASEYGQIEIPLPGLDEQVTVVRILSALLAGADRVRSAVAKAESRRLALQRSVLAAAFSGRLAGRSSDAAVVEELASA